MEIDILRRLGYWPKKYDFFPIKKKKLSYTPILYLFKFWEPLNFIFISKVNVGRRLSLISKIILLVINDIINQINHVWFD